MQKYDAIIFDLDGTLWNANQSCTAAWNSALKQLGCPECITVAGMNAVTGKPMDECIDILLPGIRNQYKIIRKIFTMSECHGKSSKEKSIMLRNIFKEHRLQNAVYIGDTLHDRDSARAAETNFIQVTYGFGKPLKNVLKFNTFKELYEYLIVL